MAAIRHFRELTVWQRSLALAKVYYHVSNRWQDFALKDQVRRAAVSVPANIAEGFERKSRADFAYFLRIARGSCAELVTLTLLAEQVGYLEPAICQSLGGELEALMKMLNGLTRSLRQTSPHQ